MKYSSKVTTKQQKAASPTGPYKRQQVQAQTREYTLMNPDRFMFFIKPKREFIFNRTHKLSPINNLQTINDKPVSNDTRFAAALVRWDLENDHYFLEDFAYQKGNQGCYTNIPKRRLKELSHEAVLMQWDIAKSGESKDFSQTQVLVRHIPTKSVMVNWTFWPKKISKFAINKEAKPRIQEFIMG